MSANENKLNANVGISVLCECITIVVRRPPFSQKRSDDVGGDPNIRYYHSYWQVCGYDNLPARKDSSNAPATSTDTADASTGDPREGAGVRPLELPAQQFLARESGLPVGPHGVRGDDRWGRMVCVGMTGGAAWCAWGRDSFLTRFTTVHRIPLARDLTMLAATRVRAVTSPST